MSFGLVTLLCSFNIIAVGFHLGSMHYLVLASLINSIRYRIYHIEHALNLIFTKWLATSMTLVPLLWLYLASKLLFVAHSVCN